MVIETVEALVFDIDDTLYPFACGFTPHRNGEMVERFMVEKLGFADRAAAKALRDEYFERTHSTLKALLVAQEEGRLPAPFEQPQLGEWWAERCDHEGLLSPQPKFIADMAALPSSVRKIVFTNSPRQYALRVLRQLGLLAPAGADPTAAAAAAASGAAAAGAASGGGGGWCFAESDLSRPPGAQGCQHEPNMAASITCADAKSHLHITGTRANAESRQKCRPCSITWPRVLLAAQAALLVSWRAGREHRRWFWAKACSPARPFAAGGA